MKKALAKLVHLKSIFNCEICNKQIRGKQFTYRAQQYIDDHIPRHLSEVCSNCIYREIYGSKNAKYKRLKTLENYA